MFKLNPSPVSGGRWRVVQDAAWHALKGRSCIFCCKGGLQLSWEVQVWQGRRKEMLMDGHSFPSLCRTESQKDCPTQTQS